MGFLKLKPHYRITFIYLIFGALWIFLSDKIVDFVAYDTKSLTFLQTIKGWFFILITSTLLFLMIRKSYFVQQKYQKEKEEIYYSIMRAVQHILNNFLSKMLFFKVAAQEHGGLKKEVMELYDIVIDESKQKIKQLSNIENISKEEIEATVFNPQKSKE